MDREEYTDSTKRKFRSTTKNYKSMQQKFMTKVAFPGLDFYFHI